MPRTKKAPASRKTARRATAPRKPSQPKVAMPDIGRPNEPADAITNEAMAKGHYELQPHIPNRGDVPLAAGERWRDEPTAGLANGRPDASVGLVTPPHLIRMVSDDPTIVVDGFDLDETGALLVPFAMVDAVRAHGFRIEHLHERSDAG